MEQLVIDLTLLKAGMTYIVSDDLSLRRLMTKDGVRILIIDDDFLK